MRAARHLAAVAVLTACNGTFRFDDHPLGTADGGTTPGPTGDESRGCRSDADCSALALRCHVDSGRCVACIGDGDCASPTPRCDEDLHVCIACRERTDCGPRQRCNEATSRCVDTCAEHDEWCPSAELSCDEEERLCLECRTSTQCAGNPRGARCDPEIGRCVECVRNAQCPADRPKCDRRIGACVACIASADCAPGLACSPATAACVSVE